MYLSSQEQVFARIERIRRRAAELLSQVAREPHDPLEDAAAEAMSLAADIDLQLPRLASLFDLTSLDIDAIVCLLAAEYDPYIRTLMRAMQRELGRPWMELGTVAELLELAPAEVPDLAASFTPGGSLRMGALVLCDDPAGLETPLVSMRVKIHSRIAQLLVGRDVVPDGMTIHAPARPLLSISLVDIDVANATVKRAERALSVDEGLVIEVTGAAGTGKRTFAEGVCAALSRNLVCVDLQTVEPAQLSDRLAEARREARLADALVCLRHWTAPVPGIAQPEEDRSGTSPSVERPRMLPPALRDALQKNQSVLFLSAEEREPLLLQHTHSVTHVEVPFPSPLRRAQLLEDALVKYGADIEPGIDFPAIARHFALDPARLEIAARASIELAAEHGVPVGLREIRESCRHQLRHDLKSLAVRVTNSHKWEDLVIPVDVYDSLREMVIYVRHAEHVYDQWGFGARHSLAQGVSALFAGPPGTGKTMCASVMARELDMELFRVDLSRVVSKWIGETEKNLGKIFDEAARSNAIILFDEADALFAKRTEVKSSVDRYANLEINFLLQKMEAFSGITILTTNFEDTLDSAFKRRLTFRMRFEKPDAEARAALWSKVFPTTAELSEDLDLVRLGALYELAGGNIRNAAVRAAFLASAQHKPIDMKVCMLAAEREAREMGLLVRSAIEEPTAAEAKPAEGRSANGRSIDLSKTDDTSAVPATKPAEPAATDEEPAKKGKAARLVPITRRRDGGT